jgi:hypothetical protein
MPLNTYREETILRGKHRENKSSRGANSAEAWFSKFHLYPNLANKGDIAEKSLAYVTNVIQSFTSGISYKRRTWQVIQWILHVNTLADVGSADEIHVPELFKHRETLVPRLEEAIFNFDPPFEVLASRPGLSDDEITIRDFLWSQLLKDNVHKKFSDCFRSGFDFGVSILKSWWEVKKRDVLVRDIKENEDGTFEVNKRFEEKVVSNRPRSVAIYPPYFIVDLQADSQEDARYMGDLQFMNLSQLQDLEAQGVFVNIDELERQKPQFDPGLFWSYNREQKNTQFADIQNDDADPRFPVVEVWGCLNLEGKGYREYVLTVANGTTVIRANENPFDDKHRPYAIASLSKNPFEIFGVGPAEPAVPLQLEHDIHRNLGVQSSRLAVSPFIRADPDADVPDSIFAIEPGTVIRARRESFEVLKFPNASGDMRHMEEILRRDMEETLGTPRIFEGSGQAGPTATEIERKIQEGNRRIRGYVREFSRMLETLLRHFHAMNRQYITDKDVFRVLGSSAKSGVYKHINPKLVDTDLDFRIIGPDNLHILGEETRNLQLFMNAAAPILQRDPDKLDEDTFLSRLERLMVGDSTKIIKSMPDIGDMRSAEEENFLLKTGERIEVHPYDEDKSHMEVHLGLLEEQGLDAQTKMEIVRHIASHELAMTRKAAQEGAKEKRMQAQGGAAVPGQGTMPGGDASTNMNRAAGATMGGANRTNGPVRADQVAAPGRDASIQKGPEQ